MDVNNIVFDDESDTCNHLMFYAFINIFSD